MVSKKSLTATPLVSVILPVYNAETYLRPAIESILNQTFRNFEFIIIDDCSRDDSWKLIQEYARQDKRIIALRNSKNLKGYATLNKGLSLTRGKYIARADNDDISYHDRLQKQVDFLNKHPNVGIVGGVMEIITETGMVVGKRKYNLTDVTIRKAIFRYSPFSHPLVMMRKSVIDTVGGYNPHYVPADDYELYFRIGKVSQFANLPDTLLKYRIVKGSMTHTLTRKMELATVQVRRKYAHDPMYQMKIFDKFLTELLFVSVFLFPSSWKMYLFQKIRNTT